MGIGTIVEKSTFSDGEINTGEINIWVEMQKRLNF